MLRFLTVNYSNDKNIKLDDISLVLNGDIWEWCKDAKKKDDGHHDGIIRLMPIKSKKGELVTYGYQDGEANRELRMLKELRKNKNLLQFTDIFPKYKNVVVCGCNELAVSFVEYLKQCNVIVSVIGKYWEYFGYKSNYEIDLEGEDKLVIYAEGLMSCNGNLYQTVRRSVSPEFECIDKIYEENVVKGKIKDTIGDFDDLVQYLKEEKEIVILGKDRVAQDVYDLLMKHGIDIYGFAEKVCDERTTLLGKTVMSIADVMRRFSKPVFINYKDKHGALGEEMTEYFDYCGYERNRQYFLLKDYINIPNSNLVHVLHRKRILLTGDRWLCKLLMDYLNAVENGEVTISYIDLGRRISIEKDDVLCLVVPDYHNSRENVGKRRKETLKQQLLVMGFINYTKYFISRRAFVLIERYLNRNIEKYSISKLVPKGILLGRIPGWSGNVFFRGVMDGHPEVLTIPYSDLNENLFYYCVRLSNIDSDKILPEFWEMYDDEACSRERYFQDSERFEESVKRMIQIKKRFTSQELFVIFHIAYIEMLSGEQVVDISKLIIYWEPHFVPRNEFPFFSWWLEDEKILGQTIALRRNNIVRTGSACARKLEGRPESAYRVMFMDMSEANESYPQHQYWTEFKMRFEDIKVNSKEKLMEICERIGIKWSDTMLQTTSVGKPLTYRGSVDFDLKSVFNNYEDFLSEFDRFRISIACSPYQKRYGYVYENCLKFSRRELQELFLKPFRFDEKKVFGRNESEDLNIREWIGWQLWNVRKHMVLNDVQPELERFELKQTAKERMEKFNEEKIAKMMEYIKCHEKLIFYGTGNDCEGLLKRMDGDLKQKILYSDKKVMTNPYVFEGKEVILPEKLCNTYKDYYILVTSSQYGQNIEAEFRNMGIWPDRVYYNEVGFER